MGVQTSELAKRRGEKRMFFIKGRKFYVCKFDIKAIIAPADIRFGT